MKQVGHLAHSRSTSNFKLQIESGMTAHFTSSSFLYTLFISSDTSYLQYDSLKKSNQTDISKKTASQMHRAPPLDGAVGGSKFLNIGFFKMQPKIVIILVLRTTENLEFSLILHK